MSSRFSVRCSLLGTSAARAAASWEAEAAGEEVPADEADDEGEDDADGFEGGGGWVGHEGVTWLTVLTGLTGLGRMGGCLCLLRCRR